MRVADNFIAVVACCVAMIATPVSAQSERQNLYQMANNGYSLKVDKAVGDAPSCSFSMARATTGMEMGYTHVQNGQGHVVTAMVFNPAFDPGGNGNIRIFRFVSAGPAKVSHFDQAVEIERTTNGFVVANSGLTNAANQKPLFDMLRTSGRLKVMKTSGVLLTELAFPDAAMKEALDAFDTCVKSLN